MKFKNVIILFFVISTINAHPLSNDQISIEENKNNDIELLVMISAKTQSLEISVKNARLIEGDLILVTSSEPKEFTRIKLNSIDSELLLESNEIEINDLINNDNATDELWNVDNGKILGKYEPQSEHDWIITNLKFDYEKSKNINAKTKCYSHWVSYVNKNGDILSHGCIRAYPTWMNDMKDVIKDFKLNEVFLPGSHDSGSYKPNFNPEKDETFITKYALTQDDNIRSQLMHGIRYLDIRMGYYPLTMDKFHMVHGITKQRPLIEALKQMKEFVEQTNEIVIFDIRKFEYGFENIDAHHKLVQYLKDHIGDNIINATSTWNVTLNEIWQSGKNIILTYGNDVIKHEYPHTVSNIVRHLWGNKDEWPALKQYLINLHKHSSISRNNYPAKSDMAELTPNIWGIITDKYGGLRNLADIVNSHVSELYLNELGPTTNILSVDFYRGTTVTELAIHFNKLRQINKKIK